MTTENYIGVHLDESDGIATLSIQGRTHLNLLGNVVFQALNRRVSQCCDDQDLRAIVLRGAGDRAFSAGVDLYEMKDLNPLQAEAFIRTLHAAARCLLHAPLPVVAAIRGHAWAERWKWPWLATRASPPMTPFLACPK